MPARLPQTSGRVSPQAEVAEIAADESEPDFFLRRRHVAVAVAIANVDVGVFVKVETRVQGIKLFFFIADNEAK